MGGRLHRNKLPDTGVSHSGTVESNQQRTVTTVKIAGVEREIYALLLLILPVESAIQNVKAEVAVHN